MAAVIEVKDFFTKSERKIKVIFVLGIAGILLILLSEIIPVKANKDESAETEYLKLSDTEKYRQSIENEITQIISDIDGVGEAKVMLMLSATEEYVFADQTDTDKRTESGSEAYSRKNQIIISDEKSVKKPVLKKILLPDISGAAIICEGADNPETCERVINTVSALLGLQSTRISVEPYK